VVHDLVAERAAGDGAGGEQVASVAQRRRQARLVGRQVGVALVGWLELEALLDAVQPGRDQRRKRQVRVQVTPAGAVLEAQRVAVAHDAQRTGAVVVSPGHGGGGERALDIALVGVHVRRQQQGQLAQAGELAGEEGLERCRLAREHGSVAVAHRKVDVTARALALVVLGHEADRHLLLGPDLLGPVLVDCVAVGDAERVAVAEVDLVLAEVALAFGVLDRQAGTAHRVADPADQRLDARAAEQRVVDVGEVGWTQVAVGLGPGVLVAVVEDEELELRARGGAPALLREALELSLEHLAGRGDDRRAVLPPEVRHAHDRCRMPRHWPQSGQVGAHREVAVAALPRRHLEAVDRRHVESVASR
jgi:hypothetical protein